MNFSKPESLPPPPPFFGGVGGGGEGGGGGGGAGGTGKTYVRVTLVGNRFSCSLGFGYHFVIAYMTFDTTFDLIQVYYLVFHFIIQ